MKIIKIELIKIKDFRKLTELLGMNIKQNSVIDITKLVQRNRIENVLEKFKVVFASVVKIVINCNCSTDKNTEKLCLKIIECLLYALFSPWPDFCGFFTEYVSEMYK